MTNDPLNLLGDDNKKVSLENIIQTEDRNDKSVIFVLEPSILDELVNDYFVPLNDVRDNIEKLTNNAFIDKATATGIIEAVKAAGYSTNVTADYFTDLPSKTGSVLLIELTKIEAEMVTAINNKWEGVGGFIKVALTEFFNNDPEKLSKTIFQDVSLAERILNMSKLMKSDTKPMLLKGVEKDLFNLFDIRLTELSQANIFGDVPYDNDDKSNIKKYTSSILTLFDSMTFSKYYHSVLNNNDNSEVNILNLRQVVSFLNNEDRELRLNEAITSFKEDAIEYIDKSHELTVEQGMQVIKLYHKAREIEVLLTFLPELNKLYSGLEPVIMKACN